MASVGAVVTLALVVPLADRAAGPYHRPAVGLACLAPALIALSLRPRWLVVVVMALASAAGGYALSLIGRSGTDPAVTVVAGLLVAAFVLSGVAAHELRGGARDGPVLAPLAALSALGAGLVAGLVALTGRHSPGGLTAEVMGAVAVVALVGLVAARSLPHRGG